MSLMYIFLLHINFNVQINNGKYKERISIYVFLLIIVKKQLMYTIAWLTLAQSNSNCNMVNPSTA